MRIPIIGGGVTIWEKVLFKLRVYFDGLLSRKKVLSESSHHIETHLDVIVVVIEVQSDVSFELCFDEELINLFEIVSCLRIHIPPTVV